MLPHALLPALIVLAPRSTQDSAEPRVVVQPKAAVRLHLHTEIATEVSMGLANAVATTVLDQDATIAPKGDDWATTRLFTVELGPVSGKLDIPTLPKTEWGPGKDTKEVDPLLAVAVESFRRTGGVTLTAKVSDAGVVEDVQGDEDLMAGLVVPPELKKLGLQVGGSDLRGRVQDYFARLPDVPLKKGATFFLDVPLDVRGALVKCRPFGRLTSVAKDKAAYDVKTELEAFEKGKLPPADKEKPLWTAASAAVKKVSFQVVASISQADGLALAQTTTAALTLEMPNPEGGGVIPTVNRIKYELSRLPPSPARAGAPKK